MDTGCVCMVLAVRKPDFDNMIYVSHILHVKLVSAVCIRGF